MKNAILLLGCLALLVAPAGAAARKAGTTTGEFLRLAAGAGPAAMGEAFTALAGDVHAVYFNPAGLAAAREREALLSHTLWYVDVNHDYAAYVHPFKGNGALGASITYLSTTFEKRSGDTEAADASGTVGESAVTLSYGRPLWGGIDGGVTVKYISSDLDGTTAGSMAFDAGLRRAFGEKIAAGLAARNLGGALDYGTDAVAVGNTVTGGLAVRGFLLKGLSLELDGESVLNNDAFSVNCGAEYLWNAYRDWSVAPRAGFKSNGGIVTAGVGIGFRAYRFDYAFSTQASLGMSNRVSLGIRF